MKRLLFLVSAATLLVACGFAASCTSGGTHPASPNIEATSGSTLGSTSAPAATGTAAGLPWVLDELARLGEQSGLGKSYPVIVDDDVAWQAVIASLSDYTEVKWAGGPMAPPIAGSLVLIFPTHTSWMDPYLDQYQSPVPISGWPSIGNMLVYIPKQPASSAPMPDEPTPDIPIVTVAPMDLLTIGGSGSGAGQLDEPTDVSLDQAGNIYVSDGRNNRIQVFDHDGKPLRTYQPTGDSALTEPWSVAVAPDGSVYVADTWNHRIEKFDAHFNFLWSVGKPFKDLGSRQPDLDELFGPRDIVVDSGGYVLVSDTGNKRVVKFSPDGQPLGSFGKAGTGPSEFSEPVGIAVAPNGDIYVADTWNRRVQRFDSKFNYISEFSVKGWSSTEVTAKPYLVVLPDGRVIISNPANARIELYDSQGKAVVAWELPTASSGAKGRPVGLALDGKGFLYIADCIGNKVYRVALASLRGPSG